MILYDYFRSSAAYRVRIALNLKGLRYEQVPVNLLENEQQSCMHKRRNPQGLVPALNHNGELLQQSLAICEYLDEVYPDSPRLLPDSPLERARVRALAQLIACDIHPVNNLRVMKYLENEFSADEAQKRQWYRHWIEEGFKALEVHLLPTANQWMFCQGDTPGLADLCLVPQCYNARRFDVDLSQFPTLLQIEANCEELQAFSMAHPEMQ